MEPYIGLYIGAIYWAVYWSCILGHILDLHTGLYIRAIYWAIYWSCILGHILELYTGRLRDEESKGEQAPESDWAPRLPKALKASWGLRKVLGGQGGSGGEESKGNKIIESDWGPKAAEGKKIQKNRVRGRGQGGEGWTIQVWGEQGHFILGFSVPPPY